MFRSQLTFLHPLTTYFFFHIYCFTWRGWALLNGATPMYGSQPQFDVIRPDEFVRALFYADASLIAICLGTMIAHNRSELSKASVSPPRINLEYVKLITLFLLPVGIVFLVLTRTGLVDSDYGGIAAMISFWPSKILLLWIFLCGFRWHLMIPMGIYLTFVGLQGYHRFMFTLPLVFLLSLFLQTRRLRWPNAYGMFAIALFLIVFPDLKELGRAIQTQSSDSVVQLLERTFDVQNRENSSDYLDQFAGALTMIDDHKRVYFGETYFYAVTLPIPRFLWQEKPGLGAHVVNIATEFRQYDKEGRIITLIGEAYINFRHLGVVVIPFLLGLFLTQWYLSVQKGDFWALSHYVYLSFFMTLIQVYRDGLSAFFYFGIFQNGPLVALVLLHLLFPLNNNNANSYNVRT